MSGVIDIVPVEGKAMLERFIRVGMSVNAGDPNYIAPLLFERRDALSKPVRHLARYKDYV